MLSIFKVKISIVACVLFAAIFMNSCVESATIEVNAPPVDGVLEANVVELEADAELLNATQILNVNNEYLVIMSQLDEGVLKVFSLPEISYLYSWGRAGRGPDELSGTSLQFLQSRDRQIILLNPLATSANLRYFSVTDTAIYFDSEEEIYLNSNIATGSLMRISDELYVAHLGLRTDAENEYISLQPGSIESTFTFGTYPVSSLEGSDKFMEFSKYSAARPDGSKLVSFYTFYNEFAIFDTDGSELVRVEITDQTLPGLTGSENGFAYTGYVAATDQYIWRLAPNITEEGLFSSPDQFTPVLEIWDWEGRPVHRYSLDKPVFHFAVSEDNSSIYSFSPFEPSELYIFDIPM